VIVTVIVKAIVWYVMVGVIVTVIVIVKAIMQYNVLGGFCMRIIYMTFEDNLCELRSYFYGGN